MPTDADEDLVTDAADSDTAGRTVRHVVVDRDDWEDTFGLVANPGGLASDECFETFGDEFATVRQVAADEPGRVWTDVDGPIVSGLHVVNRLVYHLTEQACRADVTVEVVDLAELEELADRDARADREGLDPAVPADAAVLDRLVAEAADRLAFARARLVPAADVVA